MGLPIEIIGTPLPYADGAEQSLLATLRSAPSTAAASDDLAAQATDWPTRYHLARQRTNLLWPLNVKPGMRVLDVGAGTGVNTRWLAEQGAEIVSIEGSYERAEVAAERCRDLTNVTLKVGDVADLDEVGTFDLVVCIGVLEYANDPMGGAGGAAAFLDTLTALLKPTGSLALAIENQLGLKYWMGYPEDHLGRPFVGISGYPDDGIRTYTRATLLEMLRSAGLVAHHWMYPYPDYKMPVAILTDATFAEADSVELVDQLIGVPTDPAHAGQSLIADQRAVSRVVTEGNLGADMANSFWVVASRDGAAVKDIVDTDVVAWRFNQPRAQRWMVAGAVSDDGDQRHIDRVRQYAAAADIKTDWLTQRVEVSEAYIVGTNLEQQVLESLRQGDLEKLHDIVKKWAHHIRNSEISPATGELHPYQRAGRPCLPEQFIDAGFGNFVATGEEIVQVDTEWRATGGVDADLAATRSLWNLAEVIVRSNVAHPWGISETIDELTVRLASIAGFAISDDDLGRWRLAEAAFASLVTGNSADDVTETLITVGSVSRAHHQELPGLSITDAVAHISDLERRLVAEQSRSAELARVLTVFQRLNKIPGAGAARRAVRRLRNR